MDYQYDKHRQKIERRLLIKLLADKKIERTLLMKFVIIVMAAWLSSRIDHEFLSFA